MLRFCCLLQHRIYSLCQRPTDKNSGTCCPPLPTTHLSWVLFLGRWHKNYAPPPSSKFVRTHRGTMTSSRRPGICISLNVKITAAKSVDICGWLFKRDAQANHSMSGRTIVQMRLKLCTIVGGGQAYLAELTADLILWSSFSYAILGGFEWLFHIPLTPGTVFKLHKNLHE